MLNINKNNFIFSYIIMVRYYGRMKTRTGSVNTKQLGLKMSGCPSRVGRNPVNARYISQRVACNRGICGKVYIHEAIPWRYTLNNTHPFCQEASSKCLQAAGGVGRIYTPYYRTNAPGEYGCGVAHTSHEYTMLTLTKKYSSLTDAQTAAEEIVATNADGQTAPAVPVEVRSKGGDKVLHGYTIGSMLQKLQSGEALLHNIIVSSETKALVKVKNVLKSGEKELKLFVEDAVKATEDKLKKDLKKKAVESGAAVLASAKAIAGTFKTDETKIIKFLTDSKAILGSEKKMKVTLEGIKTKAEAYLAGVVQKTAAQAEASVMKIIHDKAIDATAVITTKIAAARGEYAKEKAKFQKLEAQIVKLETKGADLVKTIDSKILSGEQKVEEYFKALKSKFLNYIGGEKDKLLTKPEDVLNNIKEKAHDEVSKVSNTLAKGVCKIGTLLTFGKKKC